MNTRKEITHTGFCDVIIKSQDLPLHSPNASMVSGTMDFEITKIGFCDIIITQSTFTFSECINGLMQQEGLDLLYHPCKWMESG